MVSGCWILGGRDGSWRFFVLTNPSIFWSTWCICKRSDRKTACWCTNEDVFGVLNPCLCDHFRSHNRATIRVGSTNTAKGQFDSIQKWMVSDPKTDQHVWLRWYPNDLICVWSVSNSHCWNPNFINKSPLNHIVWVDPHFFRAKLG
jgi:hypothetical protein